jgi:tetratricopeptide (TPR) repeat protein
LPISRPDWHRAISTSAPQPRDAGLRTDGAEGQRVTDIRDPDTAAAYLAQAEEFARHKNTSRMTEALERLAASPDCSAAQRFKAAQLFAAAGVTAEAIRYFREAGAAFIDPEADTGRAREAFGEAHALDLHDLEIIFEIARVDRIEGHPRAALAKFTQILHKTKQSHVPALFEAACIYQELGQHDQAVLTLRKVLDRDKNNVQAIINMGQRLQSMGMLPEAVGYFMQAATTAQAAGQLGTCRHVINVVIGLEPNNQNARRLLAELEDASAPADARAEETVSPIVAPPVQTEPPAPADVATPALSIPQVADYGLEAELNEVSVRNDRMQRKISALASSVGALEETVASLSAELEALKQIVAVRKAKTERRKPAPEPVVAAKKLSKIAVAMTKPSKAAPAKARTPRR